jgi:catechol-2,3-dioxygenase
MKPTPLELELRQCTDQLSAARIARAFLRRGHRIDTKEKLVAFVRRHGEQSYVIEGIGDKYEAILESFLRSNLAGNEIEIPAERLAILE